ncbi:MAG: GNAT family N-acetyltransferase [Armatimonadota bacterium]
MNYISRDPEITVLSEPDGNYRVDLMREDKSVSRLRIANRPIAVGCAQVEMGGIADVGTLEECRYQGLSRRVLQETMRFMEQSEFGLTMLYGIPNYYHKFGYASAGPNRGAVIKTQEQVPELPAGWQIRPVTVQDISELKRLYAVYLAENVCGARVRPDDSTSWRELTRVATGERADDCMVLMAPDGHVAAYAWHGKGSWVADGLERAIPSALVVSEAIAESPQAADVLLVACEIWGKGIADKESREITSIAYAVTEEGCVAAALMRRDCEFRQQYSACGNCMVRVGNLDQLFDLMMPEWRRLARQSAGSIDSMICFETPLGSKALHVNMGGVSLCDPAEAGYKLSLSVGEMAMLVIGSMPTEDLLARLPNPPCEDAVTACKLLFPKRQQHMFLADRY